RQAKMALRYRPLNLRRPWPIAASCSNHGVTAAEMRGRTPEGDTAMTHANRVSWAYTNGISTALGNIGLGSFSHGSFAPAGTSPRPAGSRSFERGRCRAANFRS